MRMIDADKILNDLLDRLSDYSTSGSIYKQILKFIRYINNAPTIQPDPDTISRKAAINAIEKACETCSKENYGVVICNSIIHLLNVLPPSPTPIIPKGHWIRWYETLEDANCVEHIPKCKCSECGTEYDPHSSQFINFCSHCGADMRQQEGGAV